MSAVCRARFDAATRPTSASSNAARSRNFGGGPAADAGSENAGASVDDLSAKSAEHASPTLLPRARPDGGPGPWGGGHPPFQFRLVEDIIQMAGHRHADVRVRVVDARGLRHGRERPLRGEH